MRNGEMMWEPASGKATNEASGKNEMRCDMPYGLKGGEGEVKIRKCERYLRPREGREVHLHPKVSGAGWE
jgi:hypothetical protein